MPDLPTDDTCHDICVVVPVYRGEQTLGPLVDELVELAGDPSTSRAGNHYQIVEIVLVHDGAIDDSTGVMRELAAKHEAVRSVWLSRNFGQHAATLAGIASSTTSWVVTLDEDGQQPPAEIENLLDAAIADDAQLVYAKPTNRPSHGWFRNTTSRLAKKLFVGGLDQEGLGEFNSFRLIEGGPARTVAAYAGNGVYLDVALSWVVGRTTTAPVVVRDDSARPSGYNVRSLLSHFRRLVLTTGTRPLRLVTLVGGLSVIIATLTALWALTARLAGDLEVQGWASIVIAVSFFGGMILLSLGIIAEYLGMAVSMAMGRPPYVISETYDGNDS